MAAQQDSIFLTHAWHSLCKYLSVDTKIILLTELYRIVTATLLFAPISMAAILDLCKSRILPRVATPARAGSDIYSF